MSQEGHGNLGDLTLGLALRGPQIKGQFKHKGFYGLGVLKCSAGACFFGF